MSTLRPLSENEWKFDLVPADQLESCYLYEYSREYFRRSPTLKGLRNRWESYERWRRKRDPKERPPIPEEHSTGHLANLYLQRILEVRLGYSIPVFLPSFPDLPWQELRAQPGLKSWPFKQAVEEARERQRKRTWRSDRFHIETLAQLEPPHIHSLPAWVDYHQFFGRDQDLSHTEYGFFAVNWDFPVPQIIRAFREWIEERASKNKPTPKFISKSRGQWRDRLHWLGALRVKNHYRKRDLVDYNESNLKVGAPYCHYPDLIEAAKKAERLMSEIFPSETEAAEIASRPLEDGPPLSEEALAELKATLLGVELKS